MKLKTIRQLLRDIHIGRMPVSQAMEIQDRLPPCWRELIYEHGQMKVFRLLQDGATIHQARRLL